MATGHLDWRSCWARRSETLGGGCWVGSRVSGGGPRAGPGLQLVCGQLTGPALPPIALPFTCLRAPKQLSCLWVSSARTGDKV